MQNEKAMLQNITERSRKEAKMRKNTNATKDTPIITVVRNSREMMLPTKHAPAQTFYGWLQKKYGCFDGKRHDSPATPQGFADHARYTVEVLEDYIWEPESNNIIEWYEWLLPFCTDEKVLECFVKLWHEYRAEVPFAC